MNCRPRYTKKPQQAERCHRNGEVGFIDYGFILHSLSHYRCAKERLFFLLLHSLRRAAARLGGTAESGVVPARPAGMEKEKK